VLVEPGPLRERFIRLRGFEFCLCEWGPENGPIVLILHGWLDQGAAWNRVARDLAAQGFHVIAPDQRGHGRSSHTPPGTTYHFAEYLADLDALFEELEPVHLLVGHSMGGTVASLYAGLRPERVERMVLVEGIGPPLASTEDAVDRMRTFLEHQQRDWSQSPMTDLDAAARRLKRFNPGLPDDEALFLAKRGTIETEAGWIWSWDPLHRSRAAVAYDSVRHRACLARIQAEVRFVQGSRSWYLGISDLDERLKSIPGPVERIELDAGHALHIDVPGELAQILIQAAKTT
jgi:pimeloyl-ACP methyl ester carboxylesterase